MAYLSYILILAALALPDRSDRHLDAVEIWSSDFSAAGDVNYDSWPDLWTRREGPQWPHYVKVQLQDDPQAMAQRCLAVELNGANASVSSPAVSVSSMFSYVAEARLKAVGLQHGSCHLQIDFCNEHREILHSVRSQVFKNTRGWTKLQIGPISVPHAEVQLAMVTLQVHRGTHVDLEGYVALDDVWLARLPRMTVSTNSSFNVYTNPNNIKVTCELSGILEREPKIHFELLDASSHHLDNNTVQLDGRLITERISKASDIVNRSKQLRKGYAGETCWLPPIHEYGFYRVRVSMKTARGTLKDQMISIAVVPPISRGSKGEFGWSLVSNQIPLDFAQLEKLLLRVGISWVKLPVWYGPSELERGDELIQFTERMAAQDVEVVGIIDRPPADLDLGRRLPADITIADLLAVEDPSGWLPSLGEVLTRLSLRVRWWQLGTDHDTSFSNFHQLEDEISKLRKQLFRFGQEVHLGLGWPWNKNTPHDKLATWEFQQLSADPGLTGSEIATYLASSRRERVDRWALVEPLDRRYYDLESRTQDLVQQMLACKIHGADGIFIAQPFDDQRGIMSTQGEPGELLLPWRTTATLLSGANYLGSIRMPEKSENHIFERADGDVFMVTWNAVGKTETLYLGESIQVMDVWGRTTTPKRDAHREIIHVGSLPIFVLGVNPAVAKWRISLNFSNQSIPSVFGIEHPNQATFTNTFGQGTGGSLTIVGPQDWFVMPNRIDFKLSTSEKAKYPFQCVLPFDASSGIVQIRSDFSVDADKKYKFSVYREVAVGDAFIELALETHLDDNGVLVVQQRLINHSEELADFRCLLYAPGRRRQRKQVFRLGNGYNTKTYRYSNGRELLGSQLWLRIEELGGVRVLNQRIVAEP